METRRGLRLGPPLLAAFALLAAVPQAVANPRIQPHPTSPALAEMARLLGPSRPFKLRTSGGFAYAPPAASQPRLLAFQDRLDPHLLQLLEAESRIERAAEDEPDAVNLDALAVLQLSRGRSELARKALAEALRLDGNSATAWNDLAVAYLAGGECSEQAEACFRALAAAEKAFSLDPDFPEALFNRAWLLQQWTLVEEAQRAWKRYLEMDPESGWSAEARTHLEALRTTAAAPAASEAALIDAVQRLDRPKIVELAQSHPQPARELAEETLLPAWANAVLDGDRKSADSTLEALGVLAEALGSSSRDTMLTREIDGLRREAVEEPKRLEEWAQGHLWLSRGRRLYGEFRIGEAQAELEKSRLALQAVGSPYALWAELYQALLAYQRDEFPEVLRIVGELSQASPDFLSFHARRLRVQAITELIPGDLSTALAHYLQSLELYEQLGEAQNSSILSLSIAENLILLGRRSEAWSYYQKALRLSLQGGAGRWRRVPLAMVTIQAFREEQSAAALLFQEESVGQARSTGRPADIGASLVTGAWLKAQLKRPEPALLDLNDARNHYSEIQDEKVRSSYLMDAALVEAEVQLQLDPAAALQEADRVVRDYRESNFQARLARAYYLRAQANLRLKRPGEAETDLARAVDQIETLRGRLAQDSQVTFFDDSRIYFDSLIALQAAENQAEAAFQTAERARARELLERIQQLEVEAEREKIQAVALPGVHDLSSIQAALAPGQALVAYRALPDRLLIWLASRDEIKLLAVSAEYSRLRSEVEKLLENPRSAESFRRESAVLYERLIRPIAKNLQGFESVVLIPDRILHTVPFAGLFDAAEGRYLIEQLSISLAPSGSLLVESHQPGPGTDEGASLSALIVADPAFDRRANPEFQALPGSLEESNRVAKIYGRTARILSGTNATAEAFLREAPQRRVLHLAVHAVANSESPLNSFLLLSPLGGGSGMLTARELYGAQLGHADLVVLSACQTAAGEISQSEGSLSLARPFLAAGVPAVVATLWPVEDEAAARIFPAFHQKFLTNRNPAQALRESQLELLHGPPRYSAPWHWSGFQVFGGATTRLPSGGH